MNFYLWQAMACFMWWGIVWKAYKKPLSSLCESSVITRPSYLSKGVLRSLHAHRMAVFLAAPISLLIGWLTYESLIGRLLAAVCVSLYHLTETSVTNRHGEYPLLYNSWGMLLAYVLRYLFSPFPDDDDHHQNGLWAGDELEKAISLGVIIHFCLSTGLAKLWVGGRSWLSPKTMGTYLLAYRDSSSPPLFRQMNVWAVDHPWSLTLFSAITLLLEVVVVPATLLLPAGYRIVAGLGMIGLHCGIGFVMSKRVAIVFFTVLPSYLVGFTSQAALFSPLWWLALAIGLGPSLFTLAARKALLPENWPLSSLALFMWAGPQAEALLLNLMKRNTRVVLANASVTPHNIVGAPVVHHLNPIPAQHHKNHALPLVHDSVLRVIGFTLVFDEVLPAVFARKQDGLWDIQAFIVALQDWLASQNRLFEAHSLQDVAKAYFVQIENGLVKQVLCHAETSTNK